MWHGKAQLLMKHLFNLQLLDLVIFQDNYIKYRYRSSGTFQILYKSELRILFNFGFALSCVCTSMYIFKCAHMNMSVCMNTHVCVLVYMCGAERNLWPWTRSTYSNKELYPWPLFEFCKALYKFYQCLYKKCNALFKKCIHLQKDTEIPCCTVINIRFPATP